MQQAWVDALEWDEVVPSEQREQWKTWFSELPLLEEIKIPHCLKDTSREESSITLHTFSDTSEKVYATAIYSRHKFEDGSVTTRLNASKTHLALLKSVSIPTIVDKILGTNLHLWRFFSRYTCLAPPPTP